MRPDRMLARALERAEQAERALADPTVKAALEIARRWREDGTENSIADIIAERDALRRSLALCQMDRTAYAEQAAQAQADLAGAEATAETLRLALAEAQADYARDVQVDRQQYADALQYGADLRAQLAQAEQRGRAALSIVLAIPDDDDPALVALRNNVQAALTPPEGSQETR